MKSFITDLLTIYAWLAMLSGQPPCESIHEYSIFIQIAGYLLFSLVIVNSMSIIGRIYVFLKEFLDV